MKSEPDAADGADGADGAADGADLSLSLKTFSLLLLTVMRLSCFQIMDGAGENDPDLGPAAHPRFCDAIKTDAAAYTALFTRTFQNKTFHVYRLKKKRKKTTKSSSEPSVTQ